MLRDFFTPLFAASMVVMLAACAGGAAYSPEAPQPESIDLTAFAPKVQSFVVVLDVSSVSSERTPQVTTLAQNFPNPFNPRTTIEFRLPRAQRVSLRIYDERGRLVRVLIGGDVLPSGPHSVLWNGRDDRDREVASGVYHYVLQTASHRLQRKLTLLR